MNINHVLVHVIASIQVLVCFGISTHVSVFITANGKTVDATQELIAIGLCNIGNSMCHGFPGSGSLSRSAVNNSSGVRTPLGGLYTGVNTNYLDYVLN